MAQHDDAPSLSEMLTTVGGDGLEELLREVVRDALQEPIEDELTTTIGAAKHERSATAAATGWCRPGRGRGVEDPQAAYRQFLPELLEPRRRVDRALWA